MFDIGWQELLLIAVVALIVIGPKDMPAAMRTVARVLSRARSLSRDFQHSVSEIMREAELDEIRRKVEQAGRGDVQGEVGRMVDPDGHLRREFDLASGLRPIFPGEDPGARSTESDDRRTSVPPPAAAAPRSAFVANPATTTAETPPSATDAAPPATGTDASPPAAQPPGSGKFAP
ncbi:MAG: Sec-independent protein translocase protein TatB [Rhodospirillales bacterium]